MIPKHMLAASICLSIITCLGAGITAQAGDLKMSFAQPALESKSHPLWFWNAPIGEDETRAIMEGAKRVGYAGFGILPAYDQEGFMGTEFLDRYAMTAGIAAELGLKLCLYDEYWFPSGSAGGQLAKRYPEALSKRLDKTETAITGPAHCSQAIPAGLLMATVAMNTVTRERIDLAPFVKDGCLEWDAPEGAWSVMFFNCVPDGGAGLVDYLDPGAVARFIELTYQRYYDRFPQHFGTTIDSAFFDEPTLYHTQGGRTWTPAFNTRYEERYGQSPALLYPAMWHDIGPETAAARNALFGFRADLYAQGFMKVINEWCKAHGIQLTGHQDQEEVVNPTGVSGDLMKVFEYQDIPGLDAIFQYGRGSKIYKLISSAAYNYDKPIVMTECYGAMTGMPTANLYKEAIDQFAKGVNLMIPHAIWSDANNITFEPELSHRTEPYASALPAYNDFIGRLQPILQQGRHVADIAVIYPIATLQAGYRFDVGDPYTGGITPEEADYLDVGEHLSLEVRRDFTFLHPEVLAGRCAVEKGILRLDNAVNHEEYRVMVLPGATTISWPALLRVREFHEQGGKVIATTRLPHQSAEFGHDADVRAAIESIFGADPTAAPRNENSAGGVALFLANPTATALQSALDALLPVYDVTIEPVPALTNGALSYLHKVVEDRDFYFIGNSSDDNVDTFVRLRGKIIPESWDPHTGQINPLEYEHQIVAEEDVTRVHIILPPCRAVLVVGG